MSHVQQKISRAILVSLFIAQPILADDSAVRQYGTQSRERQPGFSRPLPEGRPAYPQPMTSPPPATGYQSAKCIQQRRSSVETALHTRDCDNPAYSTGSDPGAYPPIYGPPTILDHHHDIRR